jgi:type I restriction enzyme M protein
MVTVLDEVEKFRKELSDRRSIGLNAYDFVEQLTYLLFLKMSHERTQSPLNEASVIPAGYEWPELARRNGAELEQQYRETLDVLSREHGFVGLMYRKSRDAIGSPAVLSRLVRNLVGAEGRSWTAIPAKEKGEMFEHLLRKAAPSIGAKASQFYTSRALLRAIVEVVEPKPGDRIADPACGTGGTLLAAYEFLGQRYDLDRDQKLALQVDSLRGFESLEGAARLAMMNLLLCGIARFDTEAPLVTATDPLLTPPTEHFDVVISNPPFGSETGLESARQDFWVASNNNQLNYVQHSRLMLKLGGRAAIFVPDNVLFLVGDGEKVRRRLFQECRVHTLLRLPTGTSFAPGVKANVLYFDRMAPSSEAATRELWVYDFRTDKRFTPVQSPLRRSDLDDFVAAFKPGAFREREESERFRRWSIDDLNARDAFNLDLWAYLSEAVEIDPRGADEILTDILGRLSTAYDRLAGLGRELGVEVADGIGGAAATKAKPPASAPPTHVE